MNNDDLIENTNVVKCVRNWGKNENYSREILITDSSVVMLGLNHVCVILSRRRDTIKSAWYYVSHRRDT